MKISKNRLRQIIKEELGRVNEQVSWTTTRTDAGGDVLSQEHIMILKQAGYDVSTINPGNMNDDMRSAIAHATGGGDIADWSPAATGGGEVYWSNGQKISQLISMLEKVKSEHGDIPVEAFEADGADIEGNASAVFDVKEPDSENSEFISETTLAIMVE